MPDLVVTIPTGNLELRTFPATITITPQQIESVVEEQNDLPRDIKAKIRDLLDDAQRLEYLVAKMAIGFSAFYGALPDWAKDYAHMIWYIIKQLFKQS